VAGTKQKPKTKQLVFNLTTKQYSDFWYVVSLLGESQKKKAFLKMLADIKRLYE